MNGVGDDSIYGQIVMGHANIVPKLITGFLFLWTICLTLWRVESRVVWKCVTLILWAMSVLLYYLVIKTGPGSPLDYSDLTVRSLEDAGHGMEEPPNYITDNCLTLKKDGRFRVCQDCKVWKPDRAHHCSSCQKCILKMDHHCPWFGECVGFRNHRYFTQFLTYTTLYSYAVLSVTSLTIYQWFHSFKFEEELIDLWLLSLWLLALVVSISMTFFTSFSVLQLLRNQTTIELYSQRRLQKELEIYRDSGVLRANVGEVSGDINVFDLGSRCANFKDVMGNRLVEWVLPINKICKNDELTFREGCGLFFRSNGKVGKIIRGNIEIQNRLLRRVTPRSSGDSTVPMIGTTIG